MPTHAGDDHTYTRRGLLTTVGALAGTSAVAGCLGGESGDADGATDGSGMAAWRTTELTDVRTDESFTLGGLEPPVLIENFAVWCPICTRQQRAMGELLGRRDDVTAVSINVDPNEDAQLVREHAAEEGFDWPVAVAPSAVTTSLKDAFGTTVLNPPSAPVIRVCGADATLLESGVKAADALAESVDAC